MADPLVKIDNLVKNYATPAGSLKVLRGINLEINRGDFVALAGPSGSGKTTFLNMITAIDAPTGGAVTVDDVNVTRAKQRELTRWRARNIGVVFQFFQSLPTLTVVDNIVVPMDFANVWEPNERRCVALDLLDRFGIRDQADKTPDMLSGGEQQRVALARALANNPPLIVGDEPMVNLDPMNVANVFDILYKLSEQGSTIIITTHDRELVQGVHKVLELDNGLIEYATHNS